MNTELDHVPAGEPANSRFNPRLLTVAAMFVLVLAVALWAQLPMQAPAGPGPSWRSSYEAALSESAETGKPVLIDFTASWCPPCHVMERDVWPNPEVLAVIEANVIPLQLDVDEPASGAIAEKYDIMYLPTVLLVDASGKELARTNFMSAEETVAFIEDHT